MKLSVGSCVFVELLVMAGLAQPDSIYEEIQRVYDFQPHLLNKAQVAAKSAALDQFWSKAKNEQARYVPGLRQELAVPGNPPFFLFDGSMLLLSLSDTSADRKVAMAAMAHCDLKDVQSLQYFMQVHRLASLNEDTIAAAFHILEDPKFGVFIVQHVLTLAQNYSLVYLLLPTDQDYWLNPAIVRLTTERDETAQKSLLLLLWYAQTGAADKAIHDFAGDAKKSNAARAYARQLMGRKAGLTGALRSLMSSETEESLRKKRRERMKAVSDEALGDLDEYTALLMSKRR